MADSCIQIQARASRLVFYVLSMSGLVGEFHGREGRGAAAQWAVEYTGRATLLEDG